MPGPTFQEVIQTLNRYWAEQGCVLIQPLDTEVGAGTFHPATFLRAIGPEPWAAAYVQPSRRPTDGRYGENPNRLQHYYQYQVVLKPNPDDILELYIGSLKALGVDPLVHDLRFVEDNWESPTLGAWGLGWEVWLNGMDKKKAAQPGGMGRLGESAGTSLGWKIAAHIAIATIPPHRFRQADKRGSASAPGDGAGFRPAGIRCARACRCLPRRTRSKTSHRAHAPYRRPLPECPGLSPSGLRRAAVFAARTIVEPLDDSRLPQPQLADCDDRRELLPVTARVDSAASGLDEACRCDADHA